MCVEIKPPTATYFTGGKTVFLAGSIEMGTADEWQAVVVDALADIQCTVLNPRRDNWDSTWEQSANNPQFAEQVDWEHEGLLAADIAVFVFDKNTKSPITLQEHGFVSALCMVHPYRKMIVLCPEGFWRKGNVDLLTAKAAECWAGNVFTVDTMDQLILKLKELL